MKRILFGFASCLLFASLGLLATRASATAPRTYWQQHVAYSIAVTVIDSIHTLDGTLGVTYTNNSPDTLRVVYFHLYYNAFQPGSMMDVRSRVIQSRPVVDRIANMTPSETGRYDIRNGLTDNGKEVKWEVQGTILKVYLNEPILPGATTNLSMVYREQIPLLTRRGGWSSPDGVAYSMSQWYPKVAEYDAEGWQIQEYIAREFYGVWGEYQVAITLPSRFTVGASGTCTNPAEVGHGYERIATGARDGVAAPEPMKTGMTTWHFYANNVHDFAWVADDDYVHQWQTWQDTITIHSLFRRNVAGLWRNSLEYTLHALKTYTELYGPYVYRDFSTTEAGDGGMEYPQLIMITGRRGTLSLAGVIAHEVGHQWFYGMLGNNESREAFMDEGFTSYVTSKATERLFGRNQIVPGIERSWMDWFLPKFDNHSDNYRGYQSYAVTGYEEPLVIPHDWFREDIGAGQVYGKTQAILSMLEYVLGDSVFARGMKEYYYDWRLKHPHLIDFQKVMERVSGTDLDWFFDEWFRTTRTLDYEAKGVSTRDRGDGTFTTEICARNNDLAVMPLDLTLHYDDGTTGNATIPLATNHGGGYKKPEAGRLFFPGWDWVNPKYCDSIVTQKRVSWFEIDTSLRLQDLNRSNNDGHRWTSFHFPRGYWALWQQLFQNPPMDGYYAVVRPIVKYDALSGLNLGIGIKHGFNLLGSGDFKLIGKTAPKRIEEDGTSASPLWYDYIDGELKGTLPMRWFERLTNFSCVVEKSDGISTVSLAITKTIRPIYLTLGAEHTAGIFFEGQDRLNYAYPYYHGAWSNGKTRVAGLRYTFVSDGGHTRADAFMENSVWNSDQTFGRMRGKISTFVPVAEDVSFSFRLVGGTGSGDVPLQRLWNLGMANSYEEQSNDFWRTVTNIDSGMDRKAHLALEGGAGVRGYALAAVDTSAASQNAFAQTTGQHMLGFSTDIALPNPLASLGSFASSFSLVAFFDAGWTGNGNADLLNDLKTRLRTDAGVSIKIAILSWLPHQLEGVAEEYAKIPVLSVTFPLYLNHPLDDSKPIAFRWQIGLGTTY
jgi:hypothetical protein